MSNIVNFTFENQSVTTAVNTNGEIFFHATELATVLGFGNARQAITSHVDKEDVHKLDTLTKGGKQKTNFVNESGMYALIFGSTKDEAKRFKRWVTSEVLPTIRKTGTYTQPTEIRHTLSIQQRHAIQKAIKQKCRKNSTHYQTVYHALYDHFKVESYKELLASDFDEAMAFITDFNLADDVSEYNSLWKLIGLLEYERIDKEIRELKRTIDTAYQQIERISRTKGLIYDAISEQKTNCPYNTNRLNEAKAFIEKQMVLKKQLGLIA